MQHVGEDSFHGILGRMGASWFRDEDFEGLYGETRGRPSVPPSQLCIALLLQTYDGVSDDEAIDRTAFDLRWKVALGLEISEKLCAKSTLQLFRSKLVLNEAYQQVFHKSIDVCRDAGLLKRSKHRAAIDTTPILGRGAVKDTFNLVLCDYSAHRLSGPPIIVFEDTTEPLSTFDLAIRIGLITRVRDHLIVEPPVIAFQVGSAPYIP